MADVRRRPLRQKRLVLQIFHSSTYRQSIISTFSFFVWVAIWNIDTGLHVKPLVFLPALCCWSCAKTSRRPALFSSGRCCHLVALAKTSNECSMTCIMRRTWEARGVGSPSRLCFWLRSLTCGISGRSAPSLLCQQWKSHWQPLFFVLLLLFSKWTMMVLAVVPTEPQILETLQSPQP